MLLFFLFFTLPTISTSFTIQQQRYDQQPTLATNKIKTISCTQLSMCQLMGMNCAAMTDFTFSFRGFAMRGGATGMSALVLFCCVIIWCVQYDCLGDLAASLDLCLSLFDCLCKPNALTYVISSLFHLRKPLNSHLPDVHSHGWGLCFYDGRGLRAFHDSDPASDSLLADFLQQNPVKTLNMVSREYICMICS